MKELKSGLKVDSQQYYQLLEWKDKNHAKFLFFCEGYNIDPSINKMSELSYMALLQFANLD
jgi:hypothetical protein